MITTQQLDFVSRLRAINSKFLDARKDLKALKEEFNELGLATELSATDWNGDNPELGKHRYITLQQLFEALGALDAGENALVTGGHVAPLLRIKE